MRWESIAEDVALRIVAQNPFNQDPGGINFLHCALIGLAYLDGCPDRFAGLSVSLRLAYGRSDSVVSGYPEWTPKAKEAHLLAAKLGGCLQKVENFYQQYS